MEIMQMILIIEFIALLVELIKKYPTISMICVNIPVFQVYCKV